MNTEELRVFIKTVLDEEGLVKTERALKKTRQSVRSLVGDFAVGDIVSDVAQNAFSKLTGGFTDSIKVAREHERVMRATSAAYGEMTRDWVDFADQLSTATNEQADAVLQASLNARSLQANFGLSVEQSRKLITLAADLSRVRGIDLEAAFNRIESAMRGEAEASEYLGVTLGDVFMKTTAANGAYKKTWETMTEAAKAQARYNELLRQSVNFTGLAAGSTNSLDAAFKRTEKSVHNLQLRLGELAKGPTIGALTFIGNFAESLEGALGAEDPNAARFFKFLGELKDQLGKGGGLVPSVQQAAQVAQEDQLKRIRELVIKTADAQERKNRIDMESASAGVRTAAAEAARVALMDQVEAAVRDITAAQREQLELQQRSVDLAAEEARIRLELLPTQQRMAELQRQMTEQQIAARRAALPATEALEDLRFAQQRAQLIAANRNVSAEERIAARRELRGIGRALPGAELAALEAGRGVTLAARAAERLGMEQQLFEISTQRQLEQITQAQTTNGYLAQIAAQRTQAIELTINLSAEEFQTEVFKQLIEAEKQAQGPTTIKLSGVRRA